MDKKQAQALCFGVSFFCGFIMTFGAVFIGPVNPIVTWLSGWCLGVGATGLVVMRED